MKLYIKYMVSTRCKMVVRDVLNNLELHYVMPDMGVVDIMEDITDNQRGQIRDGLFEAGLELMEDKKAVLIEQIKAIIIEMVHFSEDIPKLNFSDLLTEKLHYDYTYMANLFSQIQGITIEHYIIANKIERVKEYIMYDELSITEIAFKMHYSSVAHLSNQFKKVTGLSPSHYKQLKDKRRMPIDEV